MVGGMANITVNFRCPEELVSSLDKAASNDHRDRTGMLIKILSDHFRSHPTKNGSKTAAKPKTKTKAVAR